MGWCSTSGPAYSCPPAGTPTPIIDTLSANVHEVLADAVVRERFFNAALEPIEGTAEQFSQLFRSDYAKYERLMKELNIKVE